MVRTYMSKDHRNLDPYLAQKVMTAGPEQLIAYVFDAAIAACARKDQVKASRAVRELIDSLNFDHQEVAVTFFQTYRYILNQIHERNFQEARELLKDLKETWAKAMKVL